MDTVISIIAVKNKKMATIVSINRNGIENLLDKAFQDCLFSSNSSVKMALFFRTHNQEALLFTCEYRALLFYEGVGVSFLLAPNIINEAI
ncbi:MAG: hypothetical protein H6999_01655 [Hahellaceae bacterium]|nr:hypothetical protein [Hahellaceae bacterium]MCP5168456.1 hypothetical protein [Hahellaceae bacterium]